MPNPIDLFSSQRFLPVSLQKSREVYSSIDLYHLALEIAKRWKYGFYDSLIIAGALQANCTILYSEDLQNKQIIRDLQIINPYNPDFNLEKD